MRTTLTTTDRTTRAAGAGRPKVRSSAAALLLGTAVLGLTACGEESTAAGESGADVADVAGDASETIYDGPYDDGFLETYDEYVGEVVTVTADVNEVLSPSSFTIAGTEDTTVPPLLVVSANEVQGIEQDLAVAVTGTVMEEFDVVTVEEELGVDLDDELYADWEGENYISATDVDTSVASDS